MRQPPSRHLIQRREFVLSGAIAVAGATLRPSCLGQRIASDSAAKDLIFHTTTPNNGEPDLAKLIESWITPVRHFYVRSHAPNPELNADSFRLRVEGMVRNPIDLSLAQIKNFAQKTTTATLTCAGNRRSEFNTRRSEFNTESKVGGVQWNAGAIGNATWTGTALADVLRDAEVTENAKHVWFEGLDEIKKGDGIIPFGASIPIEKALLSDGLGAPLLAHAMNDAPLTPDHGFPLRTVVPGYVGARSVKWLGKVVVSDRPSPNHYLATAYKLVNKTDPLDWKEAGPIYRFPINAAIATPKADSQLPVGSVELKGYALPTGRDESKIRTVTVSADGGKSWRKAELTGSDSPFCWQLWKANVAVNADTKEIVVRAQDTSGGFMPQRAPWNAKGYLQNSWYRLPVTVRS